MCGHWRPCWPEVHVPLPYLCRTAGLTGGLRVPSLQGENPPIPRVLPDDNWEILTAARLKHSACSSSLSRSRSRQFPREEGGGPLTGRAWILARPACCPPGTQRGMQRKGRNGRVLRCVRAEGVLKFLYGGVFDNGLLALNVHSDLFL